ncbi:hypothetical protein CVD28_11160 [Bacillus sp. M6-12]|uniref:WbqC family protein n=1 Tax=Bacillus sp. M6-12 TaxID=2054166 RepID=UPI000C794F9D|nr:WbqC family protein [Bacillus sp. M6-12]PLS17551.1 hypothetical protein CVD28_11160 [Bacillus sp. M6-12]
MIVAVHQPNYLPWCGYFHKMFSCDLFVILDDVPLSKTAITNKNKIKGPDGPLMLTVPLAQKKAPIKDVTIFHEEKWPQKHWKSLQRSYARAPFWKQYHDLFLSIYESPKLSLADFNLQLIEAIRTVFEIHTPMLRSSEIRGIEGKKGDRIISICKALEATVYLSGVGAKAYNDEMKFERNQIRLVYQEFEHPVYRQLWGDFIPNLTAIDLLFNCGPKSKELLPKQVIYE